ncbi:methyltransferase domain-containing protein [Micromonospora marina]|uniref:methyltransferase domain-containing protein n=1 Tax=Micromonospora marina TaxID=307120 RepID=UPI003D70CFAB
MVRTFSELVAEAEAAPVEGWGFEWLRGRATEERPSWGYARRVADRMAGVTAALDVDTGGGEVLAEVPAPPPLPFRDAVFDLVVSRHPVHTWWDEVARVLRPGGTYLSQQIGPGTVRELSEAILGPLPPPEHRHPEKPVADARAAGLTVVGLREATLRTVFHDIGAVVWFLRKVVWTVPGFAAGRYADELRRLDERIRAEGPFVAYARRLLIEARRD